MNSNFENFQYGDLQSQLFSYMGMGDQTNYTIESLKQMQYLFNAHDNYCWGLPENGGPSFPFQHFGGLCNNNSCNQKLVEPLPFSISKEVKTRKRRKSVIEIEKGIENIYKCLSSGSLNLIIGRSKLRSQAYETPKGRSSNFIGVSKNGENWQVLINSGKFKKYIGTFTNEKEAAISYDFFSIGLHTTKAKTNFTYDSTTIVEMIESYDKKTKTFNAGRFVNRF